MLLFYVLGAAGGAFLGWLQFRLMFQIINRQGWKRYALFLFKLALWGISMLLLALWSIPVLLCFVLGATAAMLGIAAHTHHQKKEV